jgi:hypothetical protein
LSLGRSTADKLVGIHSVRSLWQPIRVANETGFARSTFKFPARLHFVAQRGDRGQAWSSYNGFDQSSVFGWLSRIFGEASFGCLSQRCGLSCWISSAASLRLAVASAISALFSVR